MLRPLPCLVFAALTLPAAAMPGAWTEVGASTSVTYAVDATSIRLDGELRTAWTLVSHEDLQSSQYGAFRSYSALRYFDCAAERSALKVWIAYPEEDGKGPAVATVERPEPLQMTEVMPETIGASALRIVCKYPLP